jgi:signal recognition particle subunit SRP54
MGTNTDPVEIAKKAVAHAKSMQFDIVIIDTAGRLHIDEELMNELKRIKNTVKPHEILLVVDSMTGQDAVNVAGSFNEKLGIDGIILTKLDGDSRGGAALSTRAVTGKPIKFAGMGEKLNDLEPFYPDRMASRILGMGDVLSLIEKAQTAFDEKQAIELEKKMRTATFTLDDFLEQMQQIKKMGPLSQILGMLPGVDAKAFKGVELDDKQFARTVAIIQSMTKKERSNPGILNAGRRQRIAKGSGTTVTDVNRLLKQFEEMKKMMKRFTGGNAKKMMKGMGGFRRPF